MNAAGTSAVTTTFGYDNNGNPTSISAPLSRNTAESYDALNRVSSITDPANGLTTFGYDAEDDLTSVQDPRSLTTSYGYDGFGDLTSQVSPTPAAPPIPTTRPGTSPPRPMREGRSQPTATMR